MRYKRCSTTVSSSCFACPCKSEKSWRYTLRVEMFCIYFTAVTCASKQCGKRDPIELQRLPLAVHSARHAFCKTHFVELVMHAAFDGALEAEAHRPANRSQACHATVHHGAEFVDVCMRPLQRCHVSRSPEEGVRETCRRPRAAILDLLKLLANLRDGPGPGEFIDAALGCLGAQFLHAMTARSPCMPVFCALPATLDNNL